MFGVRGAFVSVLVCAFIIPTSSFRSVAVAKPRVQRDFRLAAAEDKEEKGFFGRFFEELDNFIDDATSRRLGQGAQFYGKRKSSFYGEKDSMRKRNSKEADPLEDYQGPTNTGYFVWRKNEDGRLEAQTRMKGTKLEKPTMWNKKDEDSD